MSTDAEEKAPEQEEAKKKDPFADIPTNTVGENLEEYAKTLETPLQGYQNDTSSDDISNDSDFTEHHGPAGAPKPTNTEEQQGGNDDGDGIKPAPTDSTEQQKDRRWRLAVKITSLANRLFPSLLGWMHDEDGKNFKANAEDQKELSVAHYELLQPYEQELKDAYGPLFVYLMVWGIDLVAGIPNTIKKVFAKFGKKKQPQPVSRKARVAQTQPEPGPEQLQQPPQQTEPPRPVEAERIDQKAENQRPQEQTAPLEQQRPQERVNEQPEQPKQPEQPENKLPEKINARLEDLAERIASGETETINADDLQLQANYAQELEDKLKVFNFTLEDSPLTEKLSDFSKNGNITVCKCGCGTSIPKGRHFANKKHFATYREQMKKDETMHDYKDFVMYQTPDGQQFKKFKFDQPEQAE